MFWHFNYAACIIQRMVGNFSRQLKLTIWWSGVGSINFKSPKLLHKNYTRTVAQPQLWNISLWNHREVAKMPSQPCSDHSQLCTCQPVHTEVTYLSSLYDSQVQRHPASEWLQRGSWFHHRKYVAASFHTDVITDHLHHQIYIAPTVIFPVWRQNRQLFGSPIYLAIRYFTCSSVTIMMSCITLGQNNTVCALR